MQVFSAIFPILAIALFGYFVANRSVMSKSDIDAMSKFTFTFAIPLLLFTSATNFSVPEIIEWEFLLSFYISVALVYLVSVIVAKHYFGFGYTSQGVFGVGATYSNTTIVGIPVCMQTLGPDSMLPLFIIISIQNLFIFSLGIIAAEREGLSVSRIFHYILKIIAQVLKSPITLSMVLGILVNILNIPVFEPLQRSFALLSQAAIPLALFILGASINRFKLSSNLPVASTLTIIKNIALPMTVYVFAFLIFDINTLWASTAVVAAAMPIGISAYVFSENYKVCEAQVASGILLSTVLSFITVGLVLMQLNMVRM